jgi:hypothetical protein
MTFEQHVEKILEMFPNIPNPEHEPIKFAYYLRLYKYIITKKEVQNG